MHRAPTFVSLVTGLLVVSVVFWALERWRPSVRGQRRASADTVTDLVYWFFTPLVTKAITRVALGLVFMLVAVSQGLTLDDLRRASIARRTWASSLPIVIQIPLMLLLADLLAYVVASPVFHRWHHTSKRKASTRISAVCFRSSM